MNKKYLETRVAFLDLQLAKKILKCHCGLKIICKGVVWNFCTIGQSIWICWRRVKIVIYKGGGSARKERHVEEVQSYSCKKSIKRSHIWKIKSNFGFVMTNSNSWNQFYEHAMTSTCKLLIWDERVQRIILLYKVARTQNKSCASQFRCPESGCVSFLILSFSFQIISIWP